jgi:hypothetical protein
MPLVSRTEKRQYKLFFTRACKNILLPFLGSTCLKKNLSLSTGKVFRIGPGSYEMKTGKLFTTFHVYSQKYALYY